MSGAFGLTYLDLTAGTRIDLADVSIMNELLDVQSENERRVREELERRAERDAKR